MILIRLGPATPFYRALTPRWAFKPESGEGAATHGGRFNRIGLEARYLAQTQAGALAEYQGDEFLMPPATLATYLVTADPIVDFTGGYVAGTWLPIWEQAYCDWKRLANLDRVEPPSWTIGDLVRNAGAAGLLYRSVRKPEEICLVLYPDMQSAFTAPVHDPDNHLPRDQSSWS